MSKDNPLVNFQRDLHQQVTFALQEDIGDGDITASLIPENKNASARIICREEAVICGQEWVNESFHQLNADTRIEWQINDGELAKPDQTLCLISGNARSLLTAERTALNFLQTLSATATLARQYAQAVDGLTARVLDTRKTLPGLRMAQKYAVFCGGCDNHRMGLHDAVLIKENHIATAGSVDKAVSAARNLLVHKDILIEVEVENLKQLQEALNAGADRVLLDNMDIDMLKEAVNINKGKAGLEASGGITLKNIRNIATAGVDYISIGALTKDIKAIDLSMRITIDD